MHPVTPSPRRFVSGNRKQKSTEQLAVSGESTSTAKTFQKARTFSKHGSSQSAEPPKFAATPRFASKSAQKQREQETLQSGQPATHTAQSIRKTLIRPEDVEEASIDQEHNDQQVIVRDAVRLDTVKPSHTVGPPNGLPFSPKRRRLSEEHEPYDLTTPDRTQRLSEEVVERERENRALRTRPTPKFVIHNPALSDSFHEERSLVSRPTFLRPPAPPADANEPLPDAFSPHRRSQKFIPGQMASTLQQWIIETGQAAEHSRRQYSTHHTTDFAFEVELSQVKGDGQFTAIGGSHTGESVRLLLIGAKEGAESAPRRVPEAGSIVGIRTPTWQVEMMGLMWRVAVDWVVVN